MIIANIVCINYISKAGSGNVRKGTGGIAHFRADWLPFMQGGVDGDPGPVQTSFESPGSAPSPAAHAAHCHCDSALPGNSESN